MQRRERQLHLRFDAHGAHDPQISRRLDRVGQQRGLADARLAADHKHAATTGPSGSDQPVNDRRFATPIKQPSPRP